jgi:hypothetical protein
MVAMTISVMALVYSLILKHCRACDVAWQHGSSCWSCGGTTYSVQSLSLCNAQFARYSGDDVYFGKQRFDSVLRSSPA